MWEPCNLQDDFVHCCGKKGATCDSYAACMDPSYRAKHRDVCPHDDDWKVDGKIIYEYDYSNKTEWKCPGKKTIVQSEKCAWTPCKPEDNDDGHCCGKSGVAECRSISCPPDMVKRSSALNELCHGNVCGPADYDKCCTARAVCTKMTCPHGTALRYNAALFLCAGAECAATDRDQCCVPAAFCSSWVCPPFWEKKENASTIACGGAPCMEWDTGLCCNRKGMCSTLDCPVGYFKRDDSSTTPCAGIATRSCNLAIDLHRCCGQNEMCSESNVCDERSGYVLKKFAKFLTCPRAKCMDDDRKLCCSMVDPFKAAGDFIVGPRSEEGSCFRLRSQTKEDSTHHFVCTAANGVDSLHLMANFTFPRSIGNAAREFGESVVISGRTASYPLKELPVLAIGKKYNLQMHSRVAGHGIAIGGKISVFVTGYLESGASPGDKDEAEPGSASSDSQEEATTSSAAPDIDAGKSSDASEEKESVLRQLSIGRQLSVLVSASSRTCIAIAVIVVSFGQCAL